MRVNRTFVDELAREYCVYRGLVDCQPGLPGESCTEQGPSLSQTPPDQPSTSKPENTVGIDSRKSSKVGTSSIDELVVPAESEPSRENGSEPQSPGPCTEPKEPLEQSCGDVANEPSMQAAAVDEDGDVQMDDAEGDHLNGAQGEPVAPEPKQRRVWRGRPEGFRELHDSALGLHLEGVSNGAADGVDVSPCDSAMLAHEQHATEPCAATERSCEESPQEAGRKLGQPGRKRASAQEYLQTSVLGTEVLEIYREVLEIRDMASAGATGQAVEATLRLVPGFFADKPDLLFRLREVEFVK